MTRSLVLKREALTALSDVDLAGVAGAGAGNDARYSGEGGVSCPLRACADLSNLVSCYACVGE